METVSVKTGILRYAGRVGPASCAYAMEYRAQDVQRPYWVVITRVGDDGEWMEKTMQRIVNALLAGELAGVSPEKLQVVHYRVQESEPGATMRVVNFRSDGRAPVQGSSSHANWEVDDAVFAQVSWEVYVQVLDLLERSGQF